MDVDDSVHLTGRHDAQNTVWSATVADSDIDSTAFRHICHFHLDRQQNLSNRHFDVRQKGVMERNFQVDKILIKKILVALKNVVSLHAKNFS